MIGRTTLLLLAAGACGLAAVPRNATKRPPRAEPLELVVLADDRLARVEFHVTVDGRPVASIWDDTFDRLFAYYDRDGDGRLDKKEAARLPSAFGLRQVLWGQSSPYSGPPVPWKELDADRDGKVTRDELAAFYRRAGLGNASVAVGRPQSTAALTAALLKTLDLDGDGKVSEAEWKAAPKSLAKLDRNDDELIGPGELVLRISYPGATGSVQLRPPAVGNEEAPEAARAPCLLIPADPADTRWAEVVVRRLDRNRDGKLDAKEAGLPEAAFAALDVDRDGKLSAGELVAWRKSAPAVRFAIDLGKKPAVVATGGIATERLKLTLRTAPGKMPASVARSRTRLLDRFTDADANADGLVEREEVTNRNGYDLKLLFAIADRDGDGKLSRKEVADWLDLQDQIAAGHALITVLDHGAGLFELLDADQDGSLSVPELRQAWDRVKATGYSGSKSDASKLPRQLILTASQGHPTDPLGRAPRTGPAWFRAMDRNGDGFVSRREFTGTRAQFDALDADGDGFISPAEAAKAGKNKE